MSKKGSKDMMIAEGMIMDRIYVLRGKKVMIDEDLASLYHWEADRLKALLAKNKMRFPDDFMFKLNSDDYKLLKSQDKDVDSRQFNGDYPLALTERGLAMLAGLVKTNRPVAVHICIIRMFTQLRDLLPDYPELSRELKKIIR